jgi:hypothetical protein
MSRLIELEKYSQRDGLGELGGVFLENGNTEEIQRRVNPYELKFDNLGRPDFAFEMETELGRAEYKGMESMWELARSGYPYVFWLSPPGGRSVYTEGRLVVGKVIKNSKEVELECRGIPVLGTAERMVEAAFELLDKGGIIVDGIRKAEDLREQAIGINLPANGQDLWGFCEEVFGMKEVWEVIRRGDDIKRKKEVMGMVGEAMEEIKVRFGKVDMENSVVAGAMLERMMAGWGYQIVGGNHGGTNTAAMQGAFGFVFNEGKITKILANGERSSYCEKCQCWYKGDKCPYCSGNN